MTTMSTEQPLDPSLIEQTKQQIRSLYAEIAQLARSEASPEEFYAEMLPRVISALAAVGGVVWAKQQQGQLALQYQMNLQESRLAEKAEEDQIRHGRLLQKVMTTGEGMLVPANSGAGDSDQAGNPTDWLLVLGPLKTELEVVGVVEIFQRGEAGPAIQRGYLRFLLEVCALASEFLNSRQLRHFSDRQSLWTQLEEFTRLVHGSLNPRDTAYTIANEARRLIECDRVSVAIRKGDKCRVEAVSGQDMVDKRSNTVRLLGRLATVVVASEEPMWYSGDTTDMAPQVEDAVQEYVDESHTKMIAVLPLKRPQLEEKEKERPDDPDDSPPPIAALIVEQIEDSRVSQKMLSRVDVVAQHSAAALANSLEHENVFLMPVWRTLGKSRWIVKGRNLPKVVIGAVAAVVLLVAMAVVPWDFRLHAKGTLEPVLRRDVFAGIDGDRVTDVLVEHRQKVERGQVLARLVNYKLSEEITTIKGNIATTDDQRDRLQRQLALRNLPPEDATRIAGELSEKRAALAALRSNFRVYQRMEDELTVKSPTDGWVVTWDVRNRLIMRPVQRGQVLMRVGDLSGPWQLELQMSEDRMGHISLAQNELRFKVRERLREVLRNNKELRDSVREKLRKELAAESASAAARSPGVATPGLGRTTESSSTAAQAADRGDFDTRQAPAEKPSSMLSTHRLPSPAAEPSERPDAPAAKSEPPAPGAQASPTPSSAVAPAEEAKIASEKPVDSPVPQSPAATIPQPPATPPEPAVPAGNTAEAVPPGGAPLTDLDKEVDAILDQLGPDQWSKKLREVSGEEMEDRLRVSYILATDTATTHYGYVEDMHYMAEVRGEEGNTVLIKVAIDKNDLKPEHILAGAGVTAKVECGRRAVGYCWFHDLVAFFRKTWFRWF
jgi:multidrug efflux pump subunit AcrA (membrane-fusion protein)